MVPVSLKTKNLKDKINYLNYATFSVLNFFLIFFYFRRVVFDLRFRFMSHRMLQRLRETLRRRWTLLMRVYLLQKSSKVEKCSFYSCAADFYHFS